MISNGVKVISLHIDVVSTVSRRWSRQDERAPRVTERLLRAQNKRIMWDMKTLLADYWHWGCLIFLLFVVGALLVGLGWLFTRRPPRPEGALPTAILWTATPSPTPTITPPPTATPPPPTPAPAAGIGVGSRVQISGTGGDGLSLRENAGLSYPRIDVAGEGESFIIAGGPVSADGLTWWLLKDEANPEREGWGAANYLSPAP
jgi:hypothetical protein